MVTEKQLLDTNILAIFEYWQRTHHYPRARLGDKAAQRYKLIAARLADGYTPVDLLQAIDGCAASDFHMGDNDRYKAFNLIELICRNAGKVDEFMAMATPALEAQSDDIPNGAYVWLDTARGDALKVPEFWSVTIVNKAEQGLLWVDGSQSLDKAIDIARSEAVKYRVPWYAGTVAVRELPHEVEDIAEVA
ncbi:hypothetical protein [Sinimarinibacterium sp. NLF-5-8]|uniref:hypothetical protein n=1 Tax=Sinimarinibacterium sp. NLF-5-8 TaxID=2698684 RepID=UPI00137BAE45|nr:hypothetical protein [Sinimarinibacterium sp. NLF-5-8]QHS09054.1 hypothetical protein GT972_02100 [Sinimarinibacterium sp. NLF-5-8]